MTTKTTGQKTDRKEAAQTRARAALAKSSGELSGKAKAVFLKANEEKLSRKFDVFVSVFTEAIKDRPLVWQAYFLSRLARDIEIEPEMDLDISKVGALLDAYDMPHQVPGKEPSLEKRGVDGRLLAIFTDPASRQEARYEGITICGSDLAY